MTREEAIEVLETYDMSEDNDDEEFKNAIRLAIVALRDLNEDNIKAWCKSRNVCLVDADYLKFLLK